MNANSLARFERMKELCLGFVGGFVVTKPPPDWRVSHASEERHVVADDRGVSIRFKDVFIYVASDNCSEAQEMQIAFAALQAARAYRPKAGQA